MVSRPPKLVIRKRHGKWCVMVLVWVAGGGPYLWGRVAYADSWADVPEAAEVVWAERP